mgnify:CR=1 FL=1
MKVIPFQKVRKKKKENLKLVLTFEQVCYLFDLLYLRQKDKKDIWAKPDNCETREKRVNAELHKLLDDRIDEENLHDVFCGYEAVLDYPTYYPEWSRPKT